MQARRTDQLDAGLRRLSLGHARDRQPERASGGTFGWQLLAAGAQPRRGGTAWRSRGHRGANCCRGRPRTAVFTTTVHGHAARRPGALLPLREQLQQKPARSLLRHDGPARPNRSVTPRRAALADGPGSGHRHTGRKTNNSTELYLVAAPRRATRSPRSSDAVLVVLPDLGDIAHPLDGLVGPVGLLGLQEA